MKRRVRFVVALMLVVLLAGCGAKKDMSADMKCDDATATVESASETDSYAFGNAGEYDTVATEEQEMPAEAEKSGSDGNVQNVTQLDSTDSLGDRKLIRTANVELATDHFDRVKNDVELLIRQNDGYLGNSYLENQGDCRFYSIEARIPQGKLDAFLEKITKIGTVVVRNLEQTSDDVTLNYYDTTEAKKALEMERSRIMEMIDSADSLKNLITLEDKLSELNREIASYERTIRNYDNKVDFSTVNLRLSEVQPEELVEEKTTGERMNDGFKNSIENVKKFFVNLAVVLVVGSPYLIIIGVIVVILIVIIKRNKKKEEQRYRIEPDHDENKQDKKE